MIELTHKQVVVDGTPRIIMAGEVHYFRVAREEWGQRLDLVVEAGLTAVASYIPWVFHELPDGSIDVEGRTRPERDVAAFLDLCAERDLMFIARPGPFVMAELKNEGIPFRVGPVSSIGAIAVVNALKTRTAELLVGRGVVPTILTSPHFVGSAVGEEQLERVYEEYFRRVKQAYDSEGALPVPESWE